MDPITLSLIASLGSAFLPAVQAGIQNKRLNQLPDIQRPDYVIPEAEKQKMALAQTMAGNRNMPGYDKATEAIDQGVSNSIGAVRNAGGSMSDIMSAMAQANMAGASQKRDLDIQNSQYYTGQLRNLSNELGTMAGYQDRVWADKMKNYQDEAARRVAMQTARDQNMSNAMNSLVGGATMLGGYQMNQQTMDKQFANQMAMADKNTQNMMSLLKAQQGINLQNSGASNDAIMNYNSSVAGDVNVPMLGLNPSAISSAMPELKSQFGYNPNAGNPNNPGLIPNVGTTPLPAQNKAINPLTSILDPQKKAGLISDVMAIPLDVLDQGRKNRLLDALNSGDPQREKQAMYDLDMASVNKTW